MQAAEHRLFRIRPHFAHRDLNRIARTILIKTEDSNPAAAQQLTEQLTAAINLRMLVQ